MDVRPFDPRRVPSPWRQILEEEVERLQERSDVRAIGIAGSWAQEDTWAHSDIDIEVVLRGEHDFTLQVTEREGMSVDFGFFGEGNLETLPYETRPLYDPDSVMTRALESRDLDEFLTKRLREGLDACRDHLGQCEESVSVDPRSALVFLHLFAWTMSGLLVIAAGDNPTIKRRCTRLERAMGMRHRLDFLTRCGQLFGLPESLEHAEELLSHLREGYREIWRFFKGKTDGPAYMIQQPDSELWFRNRIEPVYANDRRDLIWIVYGEFPFVESFLFRNLTGHETLPLDIFGTAEAFSGDPERWVSRHIQCLDLLGEGSAGDLLAMSGDILEDAKDFVEEGHYLTG